MIGNNIWIWLVVGLIPYYIKKQQRKNGWMLQVHALFWSLEMHCSHGEPKQWIWRILLVRQLRKAVWATILHLQEDKYSQE